MFNNTTNQCQHSRPFHAILYVLTRATPEDQPADLTGGAFVFVTDGNANGDNGYVFTHTGAPTFGTTSLDVAQFSGAGQITAGAALSKSGNTMDVEVDYLSFAMLMLLVGSKISGVQP